MGSVTMLREHSVIDQVVTLADEYADALVMSLPEVTSEEMMHKVMAGALLAFLAEALTKVHSRA